MTQLHLVPHTHWDREWYLTFQQFRLKLVHLVDHLLALLQADPEYRCFMLDGQTIVLEDYLAIRPEQEEALRGFIQAGRILIGPWHILPDEFLVSPEAIIRNLLQGDRTARRFGPKMAVGYIPDPFGHIGQMPQILQGFGIQDAALQRGLSVEPCELWWDAPDGSRVFLAYLRDGYGHAAPLPTAQPDKFVSEVQRLSDSLRPSIATGHLLLMFGTDHTEPASDTSAALAYANQHLDGDTLCYSTLPEYIAQVRQELNRTVAAIPVVTGELRSCRRHNLLPGVLSTRVWIKQRNHACETLLEKWAEPFSVFAGLALNGSASQPGGSAAASGPSPSLLGQRNVEARLSNPAPILQHAWRILMECHPHDSICGCSIDQVHTEMRPRFDQAEQIGEEITRQSLQALAEQIDTRYPGPDSGTQHLPVIVFNPAALPSAGLASVWLYQPPAQDSLEIMDRAGQVVPHTIRESLTRELAYLVMDRQQLFALLGGMQGGRVGGAGAIQEVQFQRTPDALLISASLSEYAEPAEAALAQAIAELMVYLADESLDRFILQANLSQTRVEFIAPAVPALGCRTFWARPSTSLQPVPAIPPAGRIENEFFSVTVSPQDGSFTLLDRRSGAAYPGLNRFVDGGDCGDEYNYCPPTRDRLFSPAVQALRTEISPVEQIIEVTLRMDLPSALTPDRQARSAASLPLLITTRACLRPGVPRLEFQTVLDNPCADHRLRVHFPAPFAASGADYDGHFEVVHRPFALPAYDSTWSELPRPEHPQRDFVSVQDGRLGLLVANRGLREAEALLSSPGQAEIALTLLRCIGWLSRDDFPARKGQAGPGLPTPDAQMIGKHTFEYALIPWKGVGASSPQAIQAYQEAYAFNTPLRAVAA
ncbi:MAG TPA: glycoside hydrolase family 38 C-terminal domain-containing protein, partial [Anaerolineales bacterium]